MTTEHFWQIVDRVHLAADGVMTRKCELLGEELRVLSIEELYSFGSHFGNFWRRAYDWNLWAAAYLMCRGCGNDGFMDFRSTLISLGKDVYERALVDPDSLADFNYAGESPRYEGYQYVPGKIFAEKMGDPLAELDDGEPTQHPKEPTGEDFHDWDLERRLPRLCLKYGHKDADHLQDKERYERVQARAKKVFPYSVFVNGDLRSVERRLSRLMLDARMVSEAGGIPKLQQVREIMRAGRITGDVRWEPAELEEEFYWQAVMELERMTTEELRQWPHVKAERLSMVFGGADSRGSKKIP